jgi:hypothetical protein
MSYHDHLTLWVSVQSNKVTSSNLLHLLARVQPNEKDVKAAVNALTFFQWKKITFTPIFCSYFVNACVRANAAKTAADVVTDPKHSVGTWLSKKATRTLFESLAESKDFESIKKVADWGLARGQPIQTNPSVISMIKAAKETGSEENEVYVHTVAEKTLNAEGLAAFRSEFPAPEVKTSAPEAAEETEVAAGGEAGEAK